MANNSRDSQAPNWYLDPLVAAQKRQVHQEWIRRNIPAGMRIETFLKTDLFEEAYGGDELLLTLPLEASVKIGMDLNPTTVRQASRRERAAGSVFLNADVRRLPLRDARLDVVLSNSTLDHFETELEIVESLRELARILKPGGVLLVTLDNPRNPFFAILRAAMPFTGASYRLGRTLSMSGLLRVLKQAGLEPQSTAWLIHNPRLFSTFLFLSARRLLGDHADPTIRWILAAFARLEQWPTRSLTGVFLAVCSRKPGGPLS